MRCLRRLPGITWEERITYANVLSKAGVPSMFAILTQRQLRWLGHVCRMDGGRLPKDILYGELTTGMRQTGHPALRFNDTCKRDMKACGLNPAKLEQNISDRAFWRSAVKAGVEYAEENRERMSRGKEISPEAAT